MIVKWLFLFFLYLNIYNNIHGGETFITQECATRKFKFTMTRNNIDSLSSQRSNKRIILLDFASSNNEQEPYENFWPFLQLQSMLKGVKELNADITIAALIYSGKLGSYKVFYANHAVTMESISSEIGMEVVNNFIETWHQDGSILAYCGHGLGHYMKWGDNLPVGIPEFAERCLGKYCSDVIFLTAV